MTSMYPVSSFLNSLHKRAHKSSKLCMPFYEL
nr:MAG TPA: hypothetical protein [Caudoviricetes sp.]